MEVADGLEQWDYVGLVKTFSSVILIAFSLIKQTSLLFQMPLDLHNVKHVGGR